MTIRIWRQVRVILKVSQLSAATGTSVPTIKYYIREGLLPPGRGSNRADYHEDHIARLSLIKALRDVAGLSVATIGSTLAALDAGKVREALGIALGADDEIADEGDSVATGAVALVDRLVERKEWRVGAEAPGRRKLARAVEAIEEHWPGMIDLESLERYAAVAEQLARMEIPEDWDPAADDTAALRYAVLGTVLYESVLVSLRRLAHADRNRLLMERR